MNNYLKTKYLGKEIFEFHLMPQNLKFLEQINLEDINEDNTNYHQIYVSEYEHTQKTLRLQKK